MSIRICRNEECVYLPAAIQFAHDIGLRSSAEASNRIVRWTDVEDRGGHFAALEEPDLMVADLRAFIDSLQLR